AWWPRWLLLLIPVGLPLFAITVFILQKKAVFDIALSEEHLARRRRLIMVSWGIALAGVTSFIHGIAALASEGSFQLQVPWLMGIGGLVTFFGIVNGHFGARVVHATKIDDHFVWLKGVCPEYLAELPPWPAAQ